MTTHCNYFSVKWSDEEIYAASKGNTASKLSRTSSVLLDLILGSNDLSPRQF